MAGLPGKAKSVNEIWSHSGQLLVLMNKAQSNKPKSSSSLAIMKIRVKTTGGCYSAASGSLRHVMLVSVNDLLAMPSSKKVGESVEVANKVVGGGTHLCRPASLRRHAGRDCPT